MGALLAVPVVASAKVVYLELRRPPPEPDPDRFTEADLGDGSGVSEHRTQPTGRPDRAGGPEVTSVPLEDEDGNEYVIAQQNSGAAETTEGGGEYPDPETPPRPRPRRRRVAQAPRAGRRAAGTIRPCVGGP